MKSLQVQISNLQLKSPLMTASGTSGHSNEIEMLKDSPAIISSLGVFITKGVTLEPRSGNPGIRIVETRAGIINAIGLQNSGVEFFVKKELPSLLNFGLPIFVNIAANTVEEFGKLASYLSDNDASQIIKGIEINVSCPNVKKGGMAFGVDPRQVERIVKTVKNRIDSRTIVITKLTPNVTDITLPARAAIEGGTDALSMINTLRAMAIDITTGRPYLGNKTGGLSGPAIRPVGVFMVYECFEKIPECNSRKVPIIGIGGISTWQDAIEYIMAGATAIGIGTAWFVNQDVFNDIYNGIKIYLKKNEKSVSDLIGKAHEE
ncbi:MAG: dihydroorotate dehydrogenase [Thermodesulfobacteriota bacterium]|nr:dihydroorotate dehydrogenase [Thermodesulfobacteriota bacterium]